MSRKFVLVSQNFLSEKIEEAFEKADSRYDWPELTPQVAKDLRKCKFDCENVESGPGSFGPKGLMGYNTLRNGLTFCGICAGGDWEMPVFFIIYWDGTKLRGYIPTEGNPWNVSTKQAYGNSTDGVWEDGKDLKKRYPKKYEDITEREADARCDLLHHDPHKIKIDLSTRFEERK
jgi:hypothetical protein